MQCIKYWFVGNRAIHLIYEVPHSRYESNCSSQLEETHRWSPPEWLIGIGGSVCGARGNCYNIIDWRRRGEKREEEEVKVISHLESLDVAGGCEILLLLLLVLWWCWEELANSFVRSFVNLRYSLAGIIFRHELSWCQCVTSSFCIGALAACLVQVMVVCSWCWLADCVVLVATGQYNKWSEHVPVPGIRFPLLEVFALLSPNK